MDKGFSEGLLWAYPQLFSGWIGRYKFPERQFAIANGWAGILYSLCLQIKLLQDEVDFKYNAKLDVDVLQIKEKLGGLRFYTSVTLHHEPWFQTFVRKTDNFIRNWMCRWGFAKLYWRLYHWRREHVYETILERLNTIITSQESKSYKTCEKCGSEGRRCNPTGYWILTVCEECEIKIKGEQKDE